jgi:hypothetical protein
VTKKKKSKNKKTSHGLGASRSAREDRWAEVAASGLAIFASIVQILCFPAGLGGQNISGQEIQIRCPLRFSVKAHEPTV